MKFKQIYLQWCEKRLTTEQAAELLGVSERTFRRQRGMHRRKRPRKPLPGMMLHQDGSTHTWVPGKQWDLIVTMDDATSE